MIEDAMRTWSDGRDVDDLLGLLLADLGRRGDVPPSVAANVVAATRAFIAADGHHEAAAREVGPALMRLGRRAAERGQSASQLSRDLRRVLAERERVAAAVLAQVRRPEERDAIRRCLDAFFRHVHLAALRGHQQVCALLALGEEERRTRVVRLLFGEPVPAEVLRLAGIDPDVALVPAVHVDGLADLGHLPPEAVVAPDGRTVLVPAAVRLGPGAGRWVVGPARPPTDLADAITLTRQAAAALRAGHVDVDPDEGLVDCAAIADQLLVTGRPALTDLLARKYLADFAALRAPRRVELAEVLLTWLETRGSLADIAAVHHIARQTVFDRLRQGRALLGEAAERPGAHASVVVALHASLPLWRAEAARVEAGRRSRAGARNRGAAAPASLTAVRGAGEGDDGHRPLRSVPTGSAPRPAPTPQEIR